MSTVSKQLALILVKEVIADKRNRHVAPDYALHTEVQAKLSEALKELVADGSLVEHQASVNRHPAYEVSQTQSQHAL